MESARLNFTNTCLKVKKVYQDKKRYMNEIVGRTDLHMFNSLHLGHSSSDINPSEDRKITEKKKNCRSRHHCSQGPFKLPPPANSLASKKLNEQENR
uniref:Uncharacterized protein n=1 Tax=Salix viminalis TaxID=40686 RepID=A0A6N2L018_SALVM